MRRGVPLIVVKQAAEGCICSPKLEALIIDGSKKGPWSNILLLVRLLANLQ